VVYPGIRLQLAEGHEGAGIADAIAVGAGLVFLDARDGTSAGGASGALVLGWLGVADAAQCAEHCSRHGGLDDYLDGEVKFSLQSRLHSLEFLITG
jgi:hypothetical protein